MLTLKDWLELVDYKITEGSEYYLPGFADLYSLSSWNQKQDGHSFSVVFDPKNNQHVYMVEACDYQNERAYRLVDPELNMNDDIQQGWKEAWDGINWVDLESDDDFIKKSLAIKAGKEYDTRIAVPIDIPDSDLFKYMMMAHEQDITLNQFIEQVLMQEIAKFNNDSKNTKQ